MIRNALAELELALAAAEPPAGRTAADALHQLMRGLPPPTFGRAPVYRAVRGFKWPVRIGVGQGSFEPWLSIDVDGDPLKRDFFLTGNSGGGYVTLTDSAYTNLAVYMDPLSPADLLRKAVNRIQRVQTKWAEERKYTVKFDDRGRKLRVPRVHAAAEPQPQPSARPAPGSVNHLHTRLPRQGLTVDGANIVLESSVENDKPVWNITAQIGRRVGRYRLKVTYMSYGNAYELSRRVRGQWERLPGYAWSCISPICETAKQLANLAVKAAVKDFHTRGHAAQAAAEPQSPEAFWNEVLQSITAAKPLHHLTRGKDKLVVSGDLARSRITAGMFRGPVEFSAMVYREEAAQPQSMLLRFEQVSMGPKGTRREDRRVVVSIANMTPETLRRNILSHLFNSAVSSINARENERRGR